MAADIRDLRRSERFIVCEALSGSFASIDVTVMNLCEVGAMISHPTAMRIGTQARLYFRRDNLASSVPARVVWSQLTSPGPGGQLTYRSGLEVEPDEVYLDALGQLVEQGTLAREDGTLDRKRQKLVERERRKTDPGLLRIPALEPPPPDQTLLVRHAWRRLQDSPEEAERLYARARIDVDDAAIEGRADEVLAVWEYLERRVDLRTIERALRQR